MDKILEAEPLLIQIPLVIAFMLFAVYLIRIFLKHMADGEAARAQMAAQKERERLELERQNNTEWRKYLQESRDSYLKSLEEISERYATDTSRIVESVSRLAVMVSTLTETTIKHDAATIEILKALSDEMHRLINRP